MEKILGIIGVGSVGGRVAELASKIGMKLLLNDLRNIDVSRYPRAEKTDLVSLLKASDLVTVHIPLNDSTGRLIDYEKLALMKPTAYLINTSRPEIVDSRGLYRALKEGKLAGAAMEVTEKWAEKNSALLRLENFLCTPHIGAQTEEARMRVSIEAAEMILREFSPL